MKHKTGDKFIIEIESILDEQVGLYKILGFRTLVFDDYGLGMLKQIHEHDGCVGCRFVHSDGYPCIQCRNNYMDKFKPMPEEIQVGDEVKYINPNTQEGKYGIVTKKYNTALVAIDRDSLSRSWDIEDCHRTGRTYPDLIKALEQLPKE